MTAEPVVITGFALAGAATESRNCGYPTGDRERENISVLGILWQEKFHTITGLCVQDVWDSRCAGTYLQKKETENMILNQKETAVITDLHTQEKSCVEKYKRYSKEAKDPVLADLFSQLEKKEQKHFDSLTQVLNGTVPQCDCNDSDGENYHPTATYTGGANTQDKENDCFLATDCIGTEKLVSGEYNSNVFACSDPGVRKLLADIQIEEQNHAEMLYKYKTVNAMA